jgi:CHAT domain-containing protein/tetratricopeptide (TPR) repeat protein
MAKEMMDTWQLMLQLEGQSEKDPRALGPLIQVYEQLLEYLHPDNAPLLYASIKNSMGNAYYKLPVDDRGVALAQAIACFQDALRFYTPESSPHEYAQVQNSLGTAYRCSPTGDGAANIAQAIDCYREALRVWTPETDPLSYAGVQNNLGNAYKELLMDDRNAALAQAIACYQEALRFWTLETNPINYAMAQNNLGGAYEVLSTGDGAANIAQAIDCYREALRVWTPETDPLSYAVIQNNLSKAYRSLPTGDRAANLKQAIAFCQEALRVWTPTMPPFNYAGAQFNLGLLYDDLATVTGDRATNLQQAITCYREAVRVWTPETDPRNYAIAQANLGNAYANLPTGDRASNLKHAINSYQEALRVCTPETDPHNYAVLQDNLGNTYRRLPTGDRAANIAQAIACYQEALRVWTPDTDPLNYPRILNGLGNALCDLPTGDRGGNLSQAIACYQEALHFWTPQTALLDYLVVVNNLGSVYTELLIGDQADNIAQAIACFQEVLRFRNAETTPFDYATTQTNLGNAYRRLPTGDRAANIEQAIGCYQEAIRVWKLETDPLDYATVQTNLGSAYFELPTGDRAANLKQAIAFCQEALRVWTPETNPLNYAGVQYNLGNAYSELPTGDRGANLRQAIICYQEALRFYRLETAPFGCRMANAALADLYLTQGEWHGALRAYRAAMDAGELLYRAGLSVESKSTEVATNASIYRNAAFTAVRCGQIADALLILERGKTRLLAETLRLRVTRPASVPDEAWSGFEAAGVAVRAAQRGNNLNMPIQERDPLEAYRAREQAARDAYAALETAIERVRVYAPEFLPSIDLPSIRGLLSDEQTALVSFSITNQGSIGFIVSQNQDEPVQVVEIPDFTWATLPELMVGQRIGDQFVGGWLSDYSLYLEKRSQAAFDTWQQTITHTLAILGQQLLSPILSALSSSVEKIIFFPSAELFLLPLHATPLTDNSTALVGDRYVVSYAPSMEVLAGTRARTLQSVTPDLYAVINPQADPRLVFTLPEGAAIARLFAHGIVDEGAVGTIQRVIGAAVGRSYVHFACHGSYNWNDPTQSGLELADGRLTLAELQQATINLSAARLVTLSACETGLIDVLKSSPEEYVGIPAGFLLASVPCVVSSLWSVPDLSTTLLMERFYRNHVQDGMDFAAALCEAQRWIRQATASEMKLAELWERIYQSSGESNVDAFRSMRYYRSHPEVHPFAHPYFWAAFAVNGW